MAEAGALPAGEEEPVTRDWGDPDELRALLAPAASVEVERYLHAFEADSAEAFADEWMDRHPVWLAGRAALGDEAYAALRDPLLAVLEEGGEDAAGFRVSGVALVAVAQLP
jgi:hypothetical protein